MDARQLGVAGTPIGLCAREVWSPRRPSRAIIYQVKARAPTAPAHAGGACAVHVAKVQYAMLGSSMLTSASPLSRAYSL
jgi:hypothetical protein